MLNNRKFLFATVCRFQLEFFVFAYLHRGKKFIPLPYVVKGMDVSFSGLLTSVETMAKELLPKVWVVSHEDDLFSNHVFWYLVYKLIP